MGSVGTLFAIVHRTSNATSQVDWKLYRTAASGLDEDRQEVTRHAALDIWNRPNPWMPRQEFVEVEQQHVDLTGEGWWVVARNPRMRSIPLELWPVRPDRIFPVPDPQEFIRGYIYLGPDGEQVPLRVDEVIQLRMPNPLDPYRGMGPVQSILTELDSTKYSAEWNRNFFRNSALPSGIIEAPNNLSDPEFDDLRDRWEEQHRGVAAAHRVAILEGGLKWVDRRYSQKDMQFVEMREVSRETIREAFGFPKAMLGATDDVNRANAEAAEVMFARYLVVPRLERIKAALNNDFLPLFGEAGKGLEFDYCNPVPDDREADNAERVSKADAASKLTTAGFEPAGVLAAVGLPEIPFVGPQATPPAAVPAVVPAARVRPPSAARRAHILNQDEAPREDWQERLEQLLADWEGVSADQRAELLEQIEAAVVGAAPVDLAALSASSGVAAGLLEAALFAQAAAAGERVVEAAAEQGVTIEPAAVAGVLAADLAAAAVVTAAGLAAGLAVAAGREALRVWAPGMSAAEVVERVRSFLEGLSDASLRTELGGALWAAEGEGKFATLEQAEEDGNGATYYVATEERDRNTCVQCADVDGERFDTLRDARESYPHGGYFACLGTIRCRGTVEPVWGES
ncbi:phage portal protein [Nonomuraea sp. NPDC004580]|uniref:phage portal protein n=1 Tax=Nonomuraea sp. NPDC004580 TaxID=3154552 RepID=UPI0033AE2AAC